MVIVFVYTKQQPLDDSPMSTGKGRNKKSGTSPD